MQSPHRGQWTIESNSKKSGAMSGALIALGSLLFFLSRGKTEFDNNAMAAHWAGILLALLGFATFILDEQRTLLIDENECAILVRKRNRISNGSHIIRFEEIDSIYVARVGHRRSMMFSYHLKIQLKNGKSIPTGRWSFDLDEINTVAESLARTVNCPFKPDHGLGMNKRDRIAIAFFGAIAAYGLWYRIVVGPWCKAMWFGTAPPVIILIAFFAIIQIFRSSAARTQIDR